MKRRVVVSVLTFVILVGLVPLAMAPAAAQMVAWDCPTQSEPGMATPARSATHVAGFPLAGGELTVFAAASLTDAFEAIESELEAANPDLSITYNFGGSQALVTQLKEGAEADVFASANVAQVNVAKEAGLVAGEATTFVRNRLAIVTPVDNPAGIEGAADLGTEGLRLVLAQPEVPAGRYARESVCTMGIDVGTYGARFTERVAANVVSEEEDVRDVLAKVTLGEADAGIVYVSDATAAGDQVHVVDIPDAVNIVATYPIAPLAGGDEVLASAFIAYLLSDGGQGTLASFGFEPVA